MTNPGMDADIYDAFIEQLQRYVRERLIPAEDQLEDSAAFPTISLRKCATWACSGSRCPRNMAARA